MGSLRKCICSWHLCPGRPSIGDARRRVRGRIRPPSPPFFLSPITSVGAGLGRPSRQRLCSRQGATKVAPLQIGSQESVRIEPWESPLVGSRKPFRIESWGGEARCGGFLVVFVYLQAPLAVICVANEWASCTMSCINAAFGRTAGRARATARGNETNAAVKRNRCGGRNAEHSRL